MDEEQRKNRSTRMQMAKVARMKRPGNHMERRPDEEYAYERGNLSLGGVADVLPGETDRRNTIHVLPAGSPTLDLYGPPGSDLREHAEALFQRGRQQCEVEERRQAQREYALASLRATPTYQREYDASMELLRQRRMTEVQLRKAAGSNDQRRRSYHQLDLHGGGRYFPYPPQSLSGRASPVNAEMAAAERRRSLPAEYFDMINRQQMLVSGQQPFQPRPAFEENFQRRAEMRFPWPPQQQVRSSPAQTPPPLAQSPTSPKVRCEQRKKAMANYATIKSVLWPEDSTDTIPSNLLFSPFETTKKPNLIHEIDEEKAKKATKPVSKKRMIFERLEREAKRFAHDDEAPLDFSIPRIKEETAVEKEGREEEAMEVDSHSEGEGEESPDDILEKVKADWRDSIDQTGITKAFRDALIRLHQGVVTGDSEPRSCAKARMREYIFAITKIFRQFAVKQADFVALPKEDQTLLIMRNAPLCVQYIFARYATATNPKDKDNWLLLEGEDDVSDEDDGEPKELSDMKSFRDLAQYVQLFPRARSEDIDRYQDILLSIGTSELKKEQNHLVARACLFYTGDESTCLHDEKMATEGHETMLAAAESTNNVSREKLTSLLTNLDRAVQFFSRIADFLAGGQQGTADVLETVHHLATPYTEAEALWLRQQTTLVPTAMSSVPYTTERILEAVGYHFYGRQFSPRTTMESMSVNLERVRRVLLSHEEFKALPDADQHLLLRMNSFKIIALGHARIELASVASSPQKLWEWVVGEAGRSIWREVRSRCQYDTCDSENSGAGVKRYSLRAISDGGGGFLCCDALGRYEALTSRLEPALGDDRVFPVALLLVMFSDAHRLASSEGRRRIADLQRKYVMTLKRTLCYNFGEKRAAFLDKQVRVVRTPLINVLTHVIFLQFREVNECVNELTRIVHSFYTSVNGRLCTCTSLGDPKNKRNVAALVEQLPALTSIGRN